MAGGTNQDRRTDHDQRARSIATLDLRILSRPARPRQSGDRVAMNRA
jgi:hypothetical protein